MLFQDERTKMETVSDANGEWSILGLGSGKFRVTASADGYIPANTLVEIKQLSRNPPVILKLKKAEKIVASEDLMQYLEKGNALLKEKKYDDAIASYQKLLDKHPKLYKVKYKIADCYREKGDLNKAIALYEEVVTEAKDDKDINIAAKALGTIGGLYLTKKDMAKAQSYFQKSIELNPQDEILAFNVGEINFGNNNVDDAIKYFGLAIKIKPKWAEPHMKIAYCYLNKGDNQNAIKYLKKVVEMEPNSQDGLTAQEIIKSLQ